MTIRVSEREAAESFYRLVLGAVGIEPTAVTDAYAEWDDFSLSEAGERSVTSGLHIGFVAQSRSDVDAFWHLNYYMIFDEREFSKASEAAWDLRACYELR